MKYQPTFDQVACVDLGFNAVDGMLLDFIIEAPIWADKIIHNDEEYFYLAHSKIIKELPSLFGSKQAITRTLHRLSDVLQVIKKGRNNYYKVDQRLVEAWGKKSKGESYQALLSELFRKRNDTENETIPETERYRSENGTIPEKTVPKTEPINKPISTNHIHQPACAYPNNLNVEAWEKWMEYRKRMKFKKYQTDSRMKSLAEWPPGVQAWAVKRSIENEWQGLFPENYQNDSNTSQNAKPKTAAAGFWRAVSDAIPEELTSD